MEPKKTVLIVVDVQNDFLEGGSFGATDSLMIIPGINKIRDKFDFVVFTKDNHPANHISFINSDLIELTNDSDLDELTRKWKGKFPPHCIQGSDGSKFHKDLIVAENDKIFKKGENPLKEEFSGFSNPNLLSFLKENSISDVYVCGLVYDFCVGFTAIDSKSNGFRTHILIDLTKSADPTKIEETNKLYLDYGITLLESNTI
jgi:nicotinamidase/pyrazinamidase